MKYCAVLLAGAVALGTLAGCGGPDREALATRTVHSYWDNIDHGKLSKAYYTLTSGVRATRPLSEYTQDMYQFLGSTGGMTVKTGKPAIDGDQASLPVSLHFARATQNVSGYQHLFWQDGQWRISDPNGGLSRVR